MRAFNRDAFNKLILQAHNSLLRGDVVYIAENKNWVTYEMAREIANVIPYIKMDITSTTWFYPKTPILHYGSMNTIFADRDIERRKNKKVATVFHIVDTDERKYRLKGFDESIDLWHTSCSITKKKMIDLGINSEKIVIIPIPTDNDIYKPVTQSEKLNAKKKMGICDEEKIVVGYFQKDGNGWGEGLEPKLIKGPDVFCDVIDELSKDYKIHVVLSGPARGYVKKRLDKSEVPYTHFYFDDARKIAELYHAIDIYMVTSREEGGPRAILESMNSGVPIISTKVGQAVDIIKNEENGILVDIEDRNAIKTAFERVVRDKDLKEKIVLGGIKTGEVFSLNSIANAYYEKLYNSNLLCK